MTQEANTTSTEYSNAKKPERRAGLTLRFKELALPVTVGVLMIVYITGLARQFFGIDIALIAACIGGAPIVYGAIRGLLKKNLNVGGLVSIALIATLIVGEYLAGVIVVFIMILGELLENITVAKTGNAINRLMDLQPKTARLRQNGEETVVPIEQVSPGDIVLVKPGERIPVDGIVVSGQGSVNQAALTGESIPVEVSSGSKVFEGTANELGALEIETHEAGEATTLAHIIKMMNEAQANKPPTQRIADRFAKYFTPVIFVLCLVTYAITLDVLRAVTMLVVACPCALVLATPTAVVAAIGNAARRGILIKSGLALEAAGSIKAVVLDKTGTLTHGKPEVTEVRTFGDTPEIEAVRLAAVAEKFSEHPLADAILRKAALLEVAVADPGEFEVKPGRGVIADIDGGKVILGTRQMLENHQISIPGDADVFVADKESKGETCLLLSNAGRFAAVISVADRIREDAREAVSSLKAAGVATTYMLTGDNPRTATVIAGLAGVDDFAAEQLPQDKVDTVKKLGLNYQVAVVGDGINDAPALAAAHVGIAMGAIGSDAAIEAADIALLNDDISQISYIIRLGGKMVSTIRLNIFGFAVFFNLVAMGIAAAGLVGPVMGAVLHNVGSVMVVANSALLLRYK
ncbi:heavy metal translocating P-type ATPase [Candidatus Bipolaricaulota bacterium]